MDLFDILNKLLSTQNVNVARFARNFKCDFLCDFQTQCVFFWTNAFAPEKTKDDIDAKNGLLKGKRRRKTFEKYFSRIIAKLDAAAQSSELPSRKQLSLALDALLYDQRRTRLLALIWENSLKNGSPISVGNHD